MQMPYFLTTSLNLGSPPVDTQAQSYNNSYSAGMPMENQCPMQKRAVIVLQSLLEGGKAQENNKQTKSRI